MQSITIELNRFGDPEGVLKLSESYLRAIGNDPIVEASIGLKQKGFRLRMKKLRYERFRQGSLEKVRQEAETALAELIEPISELLSVPDSSSDELQQIDVVTNALELAQLPLEVLEENHRNIVLTRRVRQPWPRPRVIAKSEPKILFVWAEPFRRNSTTKRQTVPHKTHRKLLKYVLRDWLESKAPEKTLVEIGNATFDEIRTALQDPNHGFTHVHVLAHGLYDEASEDVCLLLEDDEGRTISHPSGDLKNIYKDPDLPRPGTVVLATCHSGEIDPLEAGGTLGQVLHEAGIPVVLASQLALTQTGSSHLIETFLASVVSGGDPRRALRDCRDALRQSLVETFYDRVALVGYIHLEEEFEKKLQAIKLDIALSRLEAASKSATKAETPDESYSRFKHIRAKLDGLYNSGNVRGKQLEELLGLKASSLKREAELAWNAASLAPPEEKEKHIELSRKVLREARSAYREAAALSRDNHWTMVQSLVLDAVVDGSLYDRRWDLIAACQAAHDAARCAPEAIDRLWGLGSIAELHILAPLVGEEVDFTDAQIATLLEISESEGGWPLTVVLRQIERYLNWWAIDDTWKLPDDIQQRAQAVHDALSITQP